MNAAIQLPPPAARSRRALVLLSTLLVLASPCSLPGQMQPQPVWATTNEYIYANVLTLDPGGNIFVAGSDAGDFVTAKFTPDGNLLWSARQAGRSGEILAPRGVLAIALDDAGNVYVTGGLGGSRSYDATLCYPFLGCESYRLIASDHVTVKYNRNGQRQWTATYFERGDISFEGRAIAIDPLGNVYVTGTVSSGATGAYSGERPATIKYDANGNQIWIQTNLWATTLLLDGATNLYLTGSTGTRKLDSDGNELWAVPIYGSELKLDAEGNLYVNSTSPESLVKLAADGSFVWSAPFAGRLALDNSGNVCVAGSSSTVKLDRHGEIIWQSNEGALSVVSDDAGGVLVNGSGVLRKYDPDGIRVWQAGPSSGSGAITADSAGFVYVASGSVLTKYQEVVAPGAPVISTPLPHALIRAGQDVTLSVNVTGAAPLSYLWRSIPPWFNSDRSNAVQTLVNVQTNRAGMYWVEVTNATGSVLSPAIFVSVLGPLASQTVMLGATAIFRTPLIGGGPMDYQWQFNGADLPGESHAILALTNVGAAQAGEYSVVVSNSSGNVLTSTVARLNVDRRVAQTWAATLPAGNVGDVGQALGMDTAGNVFVTGYSDCGHKTIKFDPAGAKLWEACSSNYARLGGLVVDSSGSVCITGTRYTTDAGYDIVTIKYSPAGTVLWTAPFDGPSGSNDVATALTVDSAGNFYVAGYSIGGTNGYDFVTVKYSPTGQQLWAARFDGTAHADDIATAIAVDDAGNVCVGGASSGAASAYYEFAAIKYDPMGHAIWTNRYNGPQIGDDVPSDVVADAAGNVYLTGSSAGVGNQTDFATIKYNSGGTQLWVARYNGPRSGDDNPHGLGVDASGNVYVTGSSASTNGPSPQSAQYDIATVKYAPDGTQLWVQRYNGPGNGQDYSRALALDSAGNVYVEGHSDVIPGSSPVTEVVTLSYDPAGNPRWVARHETGVESGPYYREGSLLVDDAGTVYVADTTFTGLGPAFLTLKYVQPALIRLSAPVVLPGGQLRCTLTGGAGVHYTIQVSSDLVNWVTFTDVIATDSASTDFTDTMPPGTRQRFYRAIQP